MSKKFRVSIISIISGIIFSVLMSFISYFLGKDSLLITDYMNRVLIRAEFIIAIIIFIVFGIFSFRDMSRQEVFKSALLMCIFCGIIYILENIMLGFNHYPLLLGFLFIPIKIYNSFYLFFLELGLPSMLGILASILSPLIYSFFGNRNI